MKRTPPGCPPSHANGQPSSATFARTLEETCKEFTTSPHNIRASRSSIYCCRFMPARIASIRKSIKSSSTAAPGDSGRSALQFLEDRPLRNDAAVHDADYCAGVWFGEELGARPATTTKRLPDCVRLDRPCGKEKRWRAMKSLKLHSKGKY